MSKFLNIETDAAVLEKEWVLVIQTPVTGMDVFLEALRAKVELKQGYYECCLHISAPGEQQFRALEGSHAGTEETVQSVTVVDITISIAPQELLLKQVLGVVFEHHVHEDPTIRITECWATRSKYSDDGENPNKYWNRDDAAEIHGTAIDS
ncbi:MAG: hypothetical protein V7776_13220 [Halopseudomonas aestusnigri]